jgi:hypothetical protein
MTVAVSTLELRGLDTVVCYRRHSPPLRATGRVKRGLSSRRRDVARIVVMGLVDRIRGWFKAEREEEVEEAEDVLRDPELREYKEGRDALAEEGLLGGPLAPRPGEFEER